MMSMACERAALVEAMLDGRLGAAELASTERHLASCAECTELARELTSLKRELRSAVRPITPLEHQRARLALLTKTARVTSSKRRPSLLLVAALLGLPLAAWAATSALVPAREQATSKSTRVAVLTAAPRPKHVRPESTPEPMAPLPSDEPTAEQPPPRETPRLVATPHVSASSRPSTRRTSQKAPLATTSGASEDFATAMAALGHGDFGAGAGMLASFRERYPGDPRVEDVLYLEAIALERAGRVDEAKAIARRYVTTYSRGAHLTQARRLADN